MAERTKYDCRSPKALDNVSETFDRINAKSVVFVGQPCSVWRLYLPCTQPAAVKFRLFGFHLRATVGSARSLQDDCACV